MRNWHGQIECEAAITRHENSQRPFRFYETRVFFEKKSHFPIRLEQYGVPDRAHPQPYLVEQYIYTNIRTNVGLTDNDFDIHNRRVPFLRIVALASAGPAGRVRPWPAGPRQVVRWRRRSPSGPA